MRDTNGKEISGFRFGSYWMQVTKRGTISGLTQAVHAVKPLLFELVLFAWAVIEMSKFLWAVVLGGEK